MSVVACRYLIVGGGTASGYAVRALVHDCGVAPQDITMICGEKVVPYERPALTKAYLHAPDCKIRARLPGFHTCIGSGAERYTPEWYKEQGVRLMMEHWVTEFLVAEKVVKCANGASFSFEKVFVASGCKALNPDPAMYSGPNVFGIRSLADAAALVDALESEKGQKLVIVGGGYIGLEVAAAGLGWVNSGHLESVTILNMDDRLMKRVFDDVPEFSDFLEVEAKVGLHEVKILNSVRFQGLKKNEAGKTLGIQLEGGVFVPADIVVLGMGARPCNEFMPKEKLDKRGFISVNDKFEFHTDMFAFGDCATFPLDGVETNLEHVAHCRASAKHAVRSALGKTSEPYTLLPFFYSRMFEYSDHPLIWNMFGVQKKGTPTVCKLPNGVSALWCDKDARVQAACLMLRNPPPTQEQLDAVKGMIGTKVEGSVSEMLSKL